MEYYSQVPYYYLDWPVFFATKETNQRTNQERDEQINKYCMNEVVYLFVKVSDDSFEIVREECQVTDDNEDQKLSKNVKIVEPKDV